jgi:hypothetical protein
MTVFADSNSMHCFHYSPLKGVPRPPRPPGPPEPPTLPVDSSGSGTDPSLIAGVLGIVTDSPHWIPVIQKQEEKQ